MSIAQYNFGIEYIPGINNTVADAFSRLCAMREYNTEIKIPENIYKLIALCHNCEAGHMGFDITFDRAAKLSNDNHLRSYVKKFIAECPVCQKLSDKKINNNAIRYASSTMHPMIKLNIDTIGPLPKDHKNYKYIIVIIDAFTRFIKIYPMKSVSAEESAECLLFGVPDEILTDNGSQYVNKHLLNLFNLLRTEHITITPYSSEENDIVERANKEVLRHLRNILYDTKIVETWSSYLPLIERIINAKKHSVTGISPADLLFGGMINLERRMLYMPLKDSEDDDILVSLSEYQRSMLTKQQTLMNIARENQLTSIEYKQAMVENEVPTDFPIGSLVLRQNENKTNKLSVKWLGPFEVISRRLNDNEYEIKHLGSNKVYYAHTKQLKPYHANAYHDPTKDAYADQLLFEVDNIISHRIPGTNNNKLTNANKTKALFRVRWKDYGEDDNTDEPWDNVKSNVKLHDYLRQIHAEALIPASYKQ